MGAVHSHVESGGGGAIGTGVSGWGMCLFDLQDRETIQPDLCRSPTQTN